MSNTPRARRTQAERRAESRKAVLDAATELFSRQGYAETSLEDIAERCGLTIRPIYHYFGNKKALFAAVNEQMEQRILDSMDVGGGSSEEGLKESWRAFLALCDDPAFRQIVLIDSPNVLGRERWTDSPVMRRARSGSASGTSTASAGGFRKAFYSRVLMAALAEAALLVAEADDLPMAKEEAEKVLLSLMSGLAAGSND